MALIVAGGGDRKFNSAFQDVFFYKSICYCNFNLGNDGMHSPSDRKLDSCFYGLTY